MPWITVADIRHGDRIATSPDRPQWEVASLSTIAGGRSTNFVGGVRADEANDLRVWRFGSACGQELSTEDDVLAAASEVERLRNERDEALRSEVQAHAQVERLREAVGNAILDLDGGHVRSAWNRLRDVHAVATLSALKDAGELAPPTDEKPPLVAESERLREALEEIERRTIGPLRIFVRAALHPRSPKRGRSSE